MPNMSNLWSQTLKIDFRFEISGLYPYLAIVLRLTGGLGIFDEFECTRLPQVRT